MLCDGSNGSVELLTDAIVIRRKGLANFLTQGAQGEKRIPLSAITSVQFKAAGFMAGMIQFSLMGSRDAAPGMLAATKDENAVLFEKRQQPDFERLKAAVEGRMGAKAAAPANGIGAELAQMADLVDRGFMTREEFDAGKRRLLGS